MTIRNTRPGARGNAFVTEYISMSAVPPSDRGARREAICSQASSPLEMFVKSSVSSVSESATRAPSRSICAFSSCVTGCQVMRSVPGTLASRRSNVASGSIPAAWAFAKRTQSAKSALEDR